MLFDRFHYTTYIMDALNNIRIRLQKLHGDKSKEYKLSKKECKFIKKI